MQCAFEREKLEKGTLGAGFRSIWIPLRKSMGSSKNGKVEDSRDKKVWKTLFWWVALWLWLGRCQTVGQLIDDDEKDIFMYIEDSSCQRRVISVLV
jgi:hypothetical protein